MRKSAIVFCAVTAANMLVGAMLSLHQARKPCPWQGIRVSTLLFTKQTPHKKWLTYADKGRMAVDATMSHVRIGILAMLGLMPTGEITGTKPRRL